MRMNSGKKFSMARSRAVEKAMKHPQLMDDNQLEPTAAGQLPTGGGDAGLRRVVGRGRPRKMKEMKVPDNSEEGEYLEGGAKHQGRLLAKHLMELHGGAYMRALRDGMRSESPARGGDMCGSGAPMESGKRVNNPMGREVESAVGLRRPPNALSSRVYGNPPQAPENFERNMVGEGKPMSMKARKMREADMQGAGVLRIEHGGGMNAQVDGTGSNGRVVGCGKRSARGQAIAKLMREKGMSLPEASKYLKQHGSK